MVEFDTIMQGFIAFFMAVISTVMVFNWKRLTALSIDMAVVKNTIKKADEDHDNLVEAKSDIKRLQKDFNGLGQKINQIHREH